MFGPRLKQLRNEKKITQSDLAKLLGVSPSTIGMYEQNRREPDTKTLKIFADYFEVSFDYLLGRSEYRNFDPLCSINTISLNGLDEDQIEAVRNMVEMLRKKK